jgi:histidyl-tRNA synthetase
MTQKFQTLPGMDDLLPGEIEKWQWLEDRFRVFCETHGFREIRTPVLEPTDLFQRSIGEASDIVHKEMYSFEDAGRRKVTLRPEMTASVARAVIQHSLLRQAKPIRLYYLGPMFRADKPQAGRKRQFHQFGAEVVGGADLGADFELIALLYRFLTYAGVARPVFRMNDLGPGEDRGRLAAALAAFFRERADRLCEDCRWRLEKNVLRILDCKNERCQPVIHDAPWEKLAPLGDNFKRLLDSLAAEGIPCEINRRLVRGLDYYTGAVFEVAAEGLGAQDALAGGGRYDRLFEELGGPATPCTGFSLGVERLVTVVEKTNPGRFEEELKRKAVYFAPFTPEKDGQRDFRLAVEAAALEARDRGMRVVAGSVLKKVGDHLKQADKEGYGAAVLIGPAELSSGSWILKDMRTGAEEKVEKQNLMRKLAERCAGAGER